MLNASKHEARPKISSPNPLRRIRRAVEDYDFDRLEVEAQQCVKLTSTNRPFGLIIKLSQIVFEEENPKQVQAEATPFLHSGVRLRVELVMPAKFCCRTRDAMSGMSRESAREFPVSGGHTARVTPVPIPNTEVKPRRADDTARATVWERRSPPGLNYKRLLSSDQGSLFICFLFARPKGWNFLA